MILEFLQNNPYVFLGLIFVLGLVVGSFLNVVIFRLPKIMQNEWRYECCEFLEIENKQSSDNYTLSFPPSTCPQCGHKIRAWENIPIISYLFLKGKCSNCETSISARYPLIEFLSGILSVVIALTFGVHVLTAVALIFTWMLIALTFIDYDEQLLPDDITLPLLWLGILVNTFGLITDLHSSVYGTIFGYLSLWSVYIVFKLVTGKEGMGHGDFKLLAALGAWCGWQSLTIIIILSSVAGCIYGLIVFLLFRNHSGKPFPFGPFLAVAGWIYLVFGDTINQTYLSFLTV